MFTNRLLPKTLDLIKKFNTNASLQFLIDTKTPNLYRTSQFSTSLKLNVKLFIDKENQYAHEILENSSKNYYIFKEPESRSSFETIQPDLIVDKILSTAETNNKIPTNKELLENFKSIAIHCKLTNTCISDDKFDKFIDLFTDNCFKLNDNELIECLQFVSILPEANSIHIKNFTELWNALDSVCDSRIENWDIDQLLLVSDYWYSLNLAKNSKFVWNTLRKVGRRIKKMSIEQMVQSMFLCNIVRKPIFEMFNFEVRFKQLFDEMTIDEIGVMSMGFFKTKTPIRNPEVIEKIYYRLMDEVDNVKDITLVNLLKILRYSSRIPQSKLIKKTLDKLCPQIDRFSMMSCLHISLLGSDIQQCHPQSLELIIKRFVNSIDNVRIKDMERICHVMALYDFQTESGIEKTLCLLIMDKLKTRVDEIIRYPKCFSCCLHYLSLCGFHNEEIIASALDQKFIKHTYSTNQKLGREIYSLDAFVKINLKDNYNGPYLSDKQRGLMGKLLQHYIPTKNQTFRLNQTDKLLLEVKDSVDSIYPINALKHILPHFERPDILVCYDKVNQQAIPLSDQCPSNYSGATLTRDLILKGIENPSNIITIAIITGGWNNYVRDTNKPTGLLKMKITQLGILGHNTIVVPWHDWCSLTSSNKRDEYIRSKMSKICL